MIVHLANKQRLVNFIISHAGQADVLHRGDWTGFVTQLVDAAHGTSETKLNWSDPTIWATWHSLSNSRHSPGDVRLQIAACGLMLFIEEHCGLDLPWPSECHLIAAQICLLLSHNKLTCDEGLMCGMTIIRAANTLLSIWGSHDPARLALMIGCAIVASSIAKDELVGSMVDEVRSDIQGEQALFSVVEAYNQSSGIFN